MPFPIRGQAPVGAELEFSSTYSITPGYVASPPVLLLINSDRVFLWERDIIKGTNR